jgi:hypothetical protein
MKVHIGPYRSWFGPYQLAEKILFWIPKEKDEYGFLRTPDRVHKFGEWLAHGSIEPDEKVGDIVNLGDDRPETWIYKLLKWIDKKKKRKIKVHIDKWDTWSMNSTLAHIILPMLKQLKATTHGAPYVDDEDVPEHLRSTSAPPLTEEQKNVHDVDDNHFKRWEYVLDEMIFAFQSEVDDNWEEQFTTGEYDFKFKVVNEDGTSEMVEGPNHTAVTDWDGRKAYADRMKNGFRLFGKYYQGLWD